MCFTLDIVMGGATEKLNKYLNKRNSVNSQFTLKILIVIIAPGQYVEINKEC